MWPGASTRRTARHPKAASFKLNIVTVGAQERNITLPNGTVLIDPSVPGLEYVLSSSGTIQILRRADAQPAIGSIVFQPTAAAEQTGVIVPEGTRLVGINGQIYETTKPGIFDPASNRVAEGNAQFAGAPGATIAQGTRLVGKDGTIYTTLQQVTIGWRVPPCQLRSRRTGPVATRERCLFASSTRSRTSGPRRTSRVSCDRRPSKSRFAPSLRVSQAICRQVRSEAS